MPDIMTELALGKGRLGLPSYCTASPMALEACVESAARREGALLIEATANQVDQNGGYTGLRPADYRDMVLTMADRAGVPRERLILGGDHLGPLVWRREPEQDAMAKARELVRAYTLAGYRKIHLDTSMRLGDDDPAAPLPDETVARRGAELCAVCESACRELRERDPSALPPVYVIGSEVPIPGGATEKEDVIAVTEPSALRRTVETYKEAFSRSGLSDAWERVIGVVVQPGVEFGDDGFFRYDRAAASALTGAAGEYPNIVLEGHSTDYQPRQALREMVEDGIAILKVGPALTHALREGLFALELMERELLPPEERSGFSDSLESAMLADRRYWQSHYHGGEEQLRLKRRFSFSDRSRYYFADGGVRAAAEGLLRNLNALEIPMSLLHQFMPEQYIRVRDGLLTREAGALVRDRVAGVIRDYEYAAFRLLP